MGSNEAVQLMAVLVSGVLGLAVGSFLNVVVYRLPRGMSIVQPPSHCPSCDARLTLIDLVPVVSWAFLRARCRHCGSPISWRYPLVELGTAVLCAGAAVALGTAWPLPSVAVLLVCAFAASIVDFDGAAVPLGLAAVGTLAALSLVPIAAALGHPERIAWAGLGALCGLIGGFVGDRPDGAQRWARLALVTSLSGTAGWLWPGGAALAAGWVILAVAAMGLGATKRARFAVLAAGLGVAVLVSALVNRP